MHTKNGLCENKFWFLYIETFSPVRSVSAKEKRTRNRGHVLSVADLTGLDSIFVAAHRYNLPTALTAVSCTALSALLWSTLVMEFMRELDNTQWQNTNVTIEEVSLSDCEIIITSSAIEGSSITVI